MRAGYVLRKDGRPRTRLTKPTERRMKRVLSLAALAVLTLSAAAQQQKGKLTVIQDPTIAELVNKKIVPPAATEKKTSTPASKAAPTEKKAATEQGEPRQDDSAAQKKEAPKPAARKSVRQTAEGTYLERQRYNSQGFRIQIFTGGNSRQDKVKAQQVQQKCRQRFPELSTYVHFYTPHWVCRVGDFQKRADAQRYVNKLRSSGITSEVRIVKSNIFIAR